MTILDRLAPLATGMTGDDRPEQQHQQQQQPDRERYIWIRCSGCGNGLWKAYGGRIEMPLSLRGHQRRVIRAMAVAMPHLQVQCEKCGEWSSGGSSDAG